MKLAECTVPFKKVVCLGTPNVEFIIPPINIDASPSAKSVVDFFGPGKHEVDKLRLHDVTANDFVLRVPHGRQKPKFHLMTNGATQLAAGSALNCAVACQRVHVPVVLCGSFANQDDRDTLLITSTLEQEDVRVIQFSRPSTPYSFVIYPSKSFLEQSAIFVFKPQPPISVKVRESLLERIEKEEPDCIIAAGIRHNEIELVSALFKRHRNALRVLVPNKTLLKPTMFSELYKKILKNTDLLQMNDDEVSVLLGKQLPAEQLAQKILENLVHRTGVRNIIVTQGSIGSRATLDGVMYTNTPWRPDMKIVDTTGAGDAFLIGYLWARSHAHDNPLSLRYAAYFAAKVIAERGSYCGLPHFQQLLNDIHFIEKPSMHS